MSYFQCAVGNDGNMNNIVLILTLKLLYLSSARRVCIAVLVRRVCVRRASIDRIVKKNSNQEILKEGETEGAGCLACRHGNKVTRQRWGRGKEGGKKRKKMQEGRASFCRTRRGTNEAASNCRALVNEQTNKHSIPA